MRKDLAIALAVIVVVFAAMFAVAKARVDVPLRESHPFVPEKKAAVAPGVAPATGKVVMTVNGEPVTQDEFDLAFSTLQPEEQQQYASPQGKQAFAERLVKMKMLEQEARKQGLDRDPKIASQLALEQAQLLAGAAAEKLVPTPNQDEVKKFYDQNKSRLETTDVSVIVVAVQGGAVPPRNGAPPLSEEQAMQKAAQIAQALQKGQADFAQLAKQVSDDPQTAARGGLLGAVAPGMLPPELDQAIAGAHSGEVVGPVPTRLGICVLKIGQKHTAPLEGDLKQRIEAGVKQEATMKKIEAMRGQTKVDFDPKFFPTAQPKGR